MANKFLISALMGLSTLSMAANDVYDYLSQDAPAANTYTPYYHQRASHFATLNIDNNDIVFVGNSLSDNGRWNEMFDNADIKNRGIIGDIVQGISDRIDFVTKGHPRKIFLLVGVNDVSHHLTPDSIATAVEKLIVKIKSQSPETQLYLQSWLPINNDFKRYRNMIGKEEIILQGNVLLKQVARRQDIPFIDLFSLFADRQCKLPRYMTNDGLHVNDEGYKIWRDAVAPYIAPEMTFGDELYPIGNNDIMILGNNLVGGAEWHELLDNPCVKSRNTWPDVVNSLPALAKQIAAKQPRAIVLQSSYNMPDSLPKGANLGADFDADTIVAKMQEAIDAIRQASPDTKILIQSLIPVNSTYEKYAAFNGTAKKVKAANKKLQKLAKKAKVTWVDVYPAMVDANGDLKAEYTNDGFKLMGRGYSAWAEILKPYLNE